MMAATTQRLMQALLLAGPKGAHRELLLRQAEMSTATFYKWKSKYGGMDLSMMTRLKELEAENARLKRMYADERLKSDILQDALSKKF